MRRIGFISKSWEIVHVDFERTVITAVANIFGQQIKIQGCF